MFPSRYLPLGSCNCNGTLKEHELLPILIDLVHEYLPDKDPVGLAPEELYMLLDEACPPFTYFGPALGDASDIGVWIDYYLLESVPKGSLPCTTKEGYMRIEDFYGNVKLLKVQEIWSSM